MKEITLKLSKKSIKVGELFLQAQIAEQRKFLQRILSETGISLEVDESKGRVEFRATANPEVFAVTQAGVTLANATLTPKIRVMLQTMASTAQEGERLHGDVVFYLAILDNIEMVESGELPTEPASEAIVNHDNIKLIYGLKKNYSKILTVPTRTVSA